MKTVNNLSKAELLREDTTLYILHKVKNHSSVNKVIECNKFHAGVQPDYGSGITKEDAIEFAKEIQHRFNNFYSMLEEIDKLKKENQKLKNALYEIRHKIYTLDVDGIINIIIKAD
jgi:hypothetical protein